MKPLHNAFGSYRNLYTPLRKREKDVTVGCPAGREPSEQYKNKK